MADAASFDKAWRAVTEEPPAAHHLKYLLPHRWVRFYSLPNGKRYATSEAERHEVLGRAQRLIEYVCQNDVNLLVATAVGGPSGQQPLLPDAQRAVHTHPSYWCEVRPDGDDDEEDWPLHLWGSWERKGSAVLGDLISHASEFEIFGALIVGPVGGVAIHPYDGGTDVFTANTSDRDLVRATFEAWASPRADGL
ncbi:MAG: hypothetical protein AAF467_24345 [Actinomycetota bacterium]